ncbi:MAG: TspO/MBR family protein [Pseudomonadota bacterium]
MSWIVFGVFLAANFVAASSGGIFKPGAWYESLNKPSWIPPNWAFPTVWSVLFLLNTVAGALAWEAAGNTVGGREMLPFVVYGVSLGLNFVWSALFFGMKRMDLSLVEVVLLWISLVAQMAVFAPISLPAALLALPYLAWVTTAGVLNFRMIQLKSTAARPIA